MSATHSRCPRIDRAVLLTLGVVVASAIPGAASAAGRCGLQSLHASYGMKFDGHSKNLGRFSSVSLWTFDGKGVLSASESFNSEQTGPQTRAVAGSYEVRPNCTFTILFPSTLGAQHEAVGACVLVDSAKEFYCIDVEVGWVATAVGKRI